MSRISLFPYGWRTPSSTDADDWTVLRTASWPLASTVADVASRRGHEAVVLDPAVGREAVGRTVGESTAIVLNPLGGSGGDAAAVRATRALLGELSRVAPAVQVVLVTGFSVGHGPAHAMNERPANRPRREIERELRASGLAWTIIRPAWQTDDPAGVQEVVLTQDPHVDGIVSREDLAAAIVAATEEPSARGRTFGLYNRPAGPADGPGDRSWSAAFSALRPDLEAIA